MTRRAKIAAAAGGIVALTAGGITAGLVSSDSSPTSASSTSVSSSTAPSSSGGLILSPVTDPADLEPQPTNLQASIPVKGCVSRSVSVRALGRDVDLFPGLLLVNAGTVDRFLVSESVTPSDPKLLRPTFNTIMIPTAWIEFGFEPATANHTFTFNFATTGTCKDKVVVTVLP